MLKISATQLAGFVGLDKNHLYGVYWQRMQSRLNNDWKWQQSCRMKIISKQVESRLKPMNFFKEYIQSRSITKQMKDRGDELVRLASKEVLTTANRPFRFFDRERGKYMEPLILKKYAKRHNCTIKFQQMSVSTIVFDNIQLFGDIDGIANDYVLEVKCRTKDYPVTESELLQLAVYCYALHKNGKILLYYNGSITEHLMSLDDATTIINSHEEILRAAYAHIITNNINAH